MVLAMPVPQVSGRESENTLRYPLIMYPRALRKPTAELMALRSLGYPGKVLNVNCTGLKIRDMTLVSLHRLLLRKVLPLLMH